MATDAFLNSAAWRALRDLVLERDGHRCTVNRLLGGACTGPLHVHHILDRETHPELSLDEDNCATVCQAHHPAWESLRRWFQKREERKLPACRHYHPYRSGRIECENRRRAEVGLPPIPVPSLMVDGEPIHADLTF